LPLQKLSPKIPRPTSGGTPASKRLPNMTIGGRGEEGGELDVGALPRGPRNSQRKEFQKGSVNEGKAFPKY